MPVVLDHCQACRQRQHKNSTCELIFAVLGRGCHAREVIHCTGSIDFVQGQCFLPRAVALGDIDSRSAVFESAYKIAEIRAKPASIKLVALESLGLHCVEVANGQRGNGCIVVDNQHGTSITSLDEDIAENRAVKLHGNDAAVRILAQCEVVLLRGLGGVNLVTSRSE